MWCVKFTFETILTEISQNLRFPHFPLFQIFAHLLLKVWTWTWEFNQALQAYEAFTCEYMLLACHAGGVKL